MDRIVESLKQKQVVFWEEVARDGAQAKTILNAKQRIEIAQEHAKIFNNNGPDHLVFAAGFYSIGRQEVDIIHEMADHVDSCYLAVNCRSSKEEISQSIHSLRNAKFGRVAFVSPFSERMCNLMLHKTVKETRESAVSLAKFALDKANGMPIDIQLAAAFDSNPKRVGEMASIMHELGISTIGMGDTQGKMYPKEAAEFMKIVKENANDDVCFSVHLHDDLGFATINNLEAIKQGFCLPSTSWLGLAERNGLGRTELLIFLLAHEPKMLKKRFGIDGENLFKSKPNLHLLAKVAAKVSEYTQIPIKVTDPIIGTGINAISTGTPFVDTLSFQPFDPHEVLGVNKKIYVTQLASLRVIKEVSLQMGFNLTDEQMAKALQIIKERAYKLNRSIFPEDELIEIFSSKYQ